MASIYKDKNSGIWYINYINLNGKRVRKSLGTKDKKLAQLKLKEIEVELAKGRLGFTVNISLGEFLKKYLEWSKNTKSKNTYITDEKTINNLLEYFGEKIKLSQINLQKLEGWKIWLVDTLGYSKTTANIRIRHAKAMFNKAVEWQFLEKSPSERLKQYTTPKGKPDFLTLKEIKKLFSVIENKTHLAVFNLLFWTGMRIAEAVNLTWDDVDFKEMVIKVRSKKTWHTKDYKERHIPIHPELVPHLEHLKKVNSEKVLPYKYPTVEHLFQKYSQKSGIRVSPHLLRHSIATALASMGISPQVIQKILGHSNLSTTMIYAKMTDDYVRKSLETLKMSE